MNVIGIYPSGRTLLSASMEELKEIAHLIVIRDGPRKKMSTAERRVDWIMRRRAAEREKALDKEIRKGNSENTHNVA